jgi:hypothetical protein
MRSGKSTANTKLVARALTPAASRLIRTPESPVGSSPHTVLNGSPTRTSARASAHTANSGGSVTCTFQANSESGQFLERPIARLRRPVYTAFLVTVFTEAMASPARILEEFDPLAPQREAAMFYGLFLRGHSADTLRKDIDVPTKLLNKMMRRHRNESATRQKLQRVYYYRKQVLAIFDELVTRERIKERVH